MSIESSPAGQSPGLDKNQKFSAGGYGGDSIGGIVRGKGVVEGGGTEAPLTIFGIERTQAIQYFLINGQGSAFALNNSVPLIAQRRLALRVYPDLKPPQSLGPGPLPPAPQLPTYLEGSMLVERLLPDGQVRPVSVLSSVNRVVGRPAGAIDRGQANDTLNFFLDAVDCVGTLHLIVTVSTVRPVVSGVRAEFVSDLSATTEFFVRFEPVPAFQVRLVPIHYTGLGLDITEPSGFAGASALLQSVLATYPIGRLELVGCTPIEFDSDLRWTGPGCGPGWNALLDRLRHMQAASDSRAIYVGLVPADTPTGSVAGCGNGGVAALLFQGPDYWMTHYELEHEIGHAFGRQHAPVGGADNPDPHFPTYNSYRWGSIGEFGFDTATSQLYDPTYATDFMGYPPELLYAQIWVSPYTYLGIRNAMFTRFGSPLATSRAARLTGSEREFLHLSFRMHRDGTVEVRPSFHLPGLPPIPSDGPPTEVSVQLRDANGRGLVTHPCRQLDPHQDPAGEYVDFFEVLPWRPEASSIAFLRGGDEVATVAIEDAAPELTVAELPPELLRGAASDITWTARHPQKQKQVTFMLRYSNDGGRTWRAIATHLTSTRYSVDPRLLPGGDKCVFQIVASSGIRTAVAQTAGMQIPMQPRRAQILSPADGEELTQGQAVMLRGGGYSVSFGLGAPEDAHWSSSLDGFLGRGFEVLANRLSVGTHRVTLDVPDGLGKFASATVMLRVSPAESERDRVR